MTMTRLLTATALVALLAGPVAAQTTNQPSSGQPADVEGETPATDDTAADPARTTPPVAPGERTTATDSSMTSMPTQTNPSGAAMTTQSGSMPSQGAMPSSSTSTSTSGSMSPGSMSSGSMSSGSMSTGEAMASTSGAARVTANAPIPDTAENRARYGQPESNAGRRTVGEGPVGQTRAARRRR